MMLVATNTRARLKVWGEFATAAECDELIALARPRLARSTVLDRATGGSVVMAARTSQGAALAKDETPLVVDITTRAAKTLGVPRDNLEPLQIIRYGVGDLYEPHEDWFDPKDPGSQAAMTQGGQRTKTLLIYLNTPDGGGATRFPQAGAEVSAITGNAAQFEYPTATVADECLHGGDPVTAGEKFAVNVWARERAYGSSAASRVHVAPVFSLAQCHDLRALYDAAKTNEGGTDNVIRPNLDHPLIRRSIEMVTAQVAAAFPGERMTPETVVLACIKPGVSMENHADNVRWNGSAFEPNHTPNRTHTAVVTLTTGEGGVTHYGDNEGGRATYSLDVPQVAGQMHTHRCGPDYFHRVSASTSPRLTFIVWFKA